MQPLAGPPEAQSPRLTSAALDAIPATLALLDSRGTILLVNKSWRDFGARNGLMMPDDGVGSNYFDVCDAATATGDEYARPARVAIEGVLAGRVPTVTFEYPCHSPDEKRWFVFSCAAFEDDETKYAVVTHHDVTARRIAEDALRAGTEALESYNMFVSHDLRAPLRRIEGLAEVLVQSAPPQKASILHRIRAEAARARELADDLLALSRITTKDVQRTSVDVSAIARDVVARLALDAPHRNVVIEIEPGLTDLADERLVRVILANLLSNAWKYTMRAAEPRIEVASSPSGSVTTYHVRDNGLGFAQADASRLFEPFERLESAHAFEGTGVGLAIVRRAVEHHGGRVFAKGELGRGATFSFSLHPPLA